MESPRIFTEDRSWRSRANCMGVDPNLFSERGVNTRETKEVCAGCVVKDECLEYALDNSEKFGIWGGTSERERRRIKRARAATRQEVIASESGELATQTQAELKERPEPTEPSAVNE